MNYPKHHGLLASLIFVLAIGAAPAALAQKAALVRDIDRPAASPVMAPCNGSPHICQAIVVPAGKVFVLEAVSYEVGVVANATSVIFFIVIHSSPSNLDLFVTTAPPVVSPQTGNTFYSATTPTRGYFPAGTVITAEARTNVPAEVLLSRFMLIGYLVDQ